jgi:hypothetical protein
MILLAAIVVVGCVACLAFHYWNQVFGQESSVRTVPFNRWLWAGLIIPGLGWLLLNCGILPGLPPLLPDIAVARSAGQSWIPLIFQLTAPGLLVIGSYWAAVSFGRLTVAVAVHAESRREFAVTAAVVSLLSLPLIGLCVWGGGAPWAGLALLCWLFPVTHCTLSLACQPKPMPMYARAIARMKFGKYKEAEREVIQELEKREDDVEGWMMLAELYANQFGDVAEAERTIGWLCDQPSVTPLQISIAYHRLADWQLKLCDNPAAAKRALEEICRRLPDSHLAKMARLRQQQLPASRQEWLELKHPKKIALPALTGELEAPAPGPGTKLNRRDALGLANECVDRLKRNSNDVPSREKLARLFTEELDKADLGIEQLDLLLGMPDQPEQKRAEWLSLSAAWHFRYRQDRATTRQILERLVQELGQTPQAFAAQRWLSLLDMEERMQKTSPANQAAEAVQGAL